MLLLEKQISTWLTVVRGTSAVTQMLTNDLRANHDLSLPWLSVLANLYQAPEHTLRMNELAEAVLMSGSGLTRVLDRMIEADLIARKGCPTDRRVIYATLTEAGLKKTEVVLPEHQQLIYSHFLNHLDENEQVVIRTAFERILAQAQAQYGECK